MLEGGVYTWVLPLGRTIAGFVIGVFLGILGGWAALIFSAMIGFPWSGDVHRNMFFISVGLGAGLGCYFGWMNLALPWHLIAGSILIVLAGGIAGAYIGLEYGRNVDPTYLGRAYTVNNWLHYGAAIGGIIVSTALGLFTEIRTMGR